ncbi:MAG: rRNA maturation RNase YbeY [Chlorobi bacterium]|nr:rRNA maturation RNase YbeY [Chlorobiota bacterium]
MLFHVNSPKFRIIGKNQIKNWLKITIVEEGFCVGNLNIIFVTDDELMEINKKFLEHDYYTDIITFNYKEKKKISGDLFISIERVMENAIKFKSSVTNEFLRVIIHGVLHIIGYNDKTYNEKKEIRNKENFYLGKISNERIGISNGI